jgi:hypothetical protein
MNFKGRLYMLSLILACQCGLALAQDGDDSAREQAAAAAREESIRRTQELNAAREAREQQQRSQEQMREFLRDSRETVDGFNREAERRRALQLQVEYAQIRTAFQTWESARQQLSEAIGLKAKAKEPAKSIEKSANAFLDFIKRRNTLRQRFDSTVFKGFTETELRWEALATVERLAPQLSAVTLSQDQSSINIQFLLSLSKLETELLRLKWLLGKLK